MKQSLAVATLLTCGAVAALALEPPYRMNPQCAAQQQQKRNGNSGKEARGKKTGPQDGTGPIHPPGTGWGAGAGRRAGRM